MTNPLLLLRQKESESEAMIEVHILKQIVVEDIPGCPDSPLCNCSNELYKHSEWYYYEIIIIMRTHIDNSSITDSLFAVKILK